MSNLEWELNLEERTIFGLRNLYRSFGYLPYRMGKFEEYELYAQNKSFLRSDRILTFTDTDGRLLALRPDVTLSIVRNYNGEALQKLFYQEAVFRPSPSGFREIRQCGLECIGQIDRYQQSEVLVLAARSLALLNDSYLLDVSHLQYTSELVDALFSPDSRKAVMRYLARKNAAGIREICRREDLSDETAEQLICLVLSYGDSEKMLPLMRGMIRNGKMQAALKELEELLKLVSVCGLKDRIRIDLSMIDDIEYYNGLIFRGMITGIPEPILSGGRYDHLLQKMGKQASAIGFAVYLDLLTYLEQERGDAEADVLLRYGPEEAAEDIARAAEALRREAAHVRVDRADSKVRGRRTARLEKGKVIFDD